MRSYFPVSLQPLASVNHPVLPVNCALKITFAPSNLFYWTLMACYACTMPESLHFWDICEAVHCLPDGAALRPGGNKPILSFFIPALKLLEQVGYCLYYARSCLSEDICECGQRTLVIPYPFPNQRRFVLCREQIQMCSKYHLLLMYSTCFFCCKSSRCRKGWLYVLFPLATG